MCLPRLLLAYEIPAARGTHARRVHCPGRTIAAFSGSIGCAAAAHRQRHLSFEDDVPGLNRVSVVGIAAIRPVLPDVSTTKTLVMQLFFEFGSVHCCRCFARKSRAILFVCHCCGINIRAATRVTNRRGASPDSSRRSRGLLVVDMLRARDASRVRELISAIPPSRYNGFHLVFADAREMAVAVCDGDRLEIHSLAPGEPHLITERSYGAGEGVREAEVMREVAPLLLQPDGSKSLSNYSGGQIDLISPNKNPASGNATINWTLTYPQ